MAEVSAAMEQARGRITATVELPADELVGLLSRLDELCDAASALVAFHGAEPGAVSTATVAEAVERLAAAVEAMREGTS